MAVRLAIRTILWLVIAGLTYWLVMIIYEDIQTQKEKERVESLRKERLLDIKDIQMAMKDEFNRFSGSFEELDSFVRHGFITKLKTNRIRRPDVPADSVLPDTVPEFIDVSDTTRVPAKHSIFPDKTDFLIGLFPTYSHLMPLLGLPKDSVPTYANIRKLVEANRQTLITSNAQIANDFKKGVSDDNLMYRHNAQLHDSFANESFTIGYVPVPYGKANWLNKKQKKARKKAKEAGETYTMPKNLSRPLFEMKADKKVVRNVPILVFQVVDPIPFDNEDEPLSLGSLDRANYDLNR